MSYKDYVAQESQFAADAASELVFGCLGRFFLFLVIIFVIWALVSS